MEQHHGAVLGVDLVERVPDQPVIVKVETAGEGDLRAYRQMHFVVGAFRLLLVREWLLLSPLTWPLQT